MIDRLLRGWTGSLDFRARGEAQRQLHAHPKMHQVRYGAGERLLRVLFSIRTFGGFMGLYLALNLAVGFMEIFSVHVLPDLLPNAAPNPPELQVEIEELMLNISSYLLGAQIGLLGVISLSLTLVTLIAQREGSATDIQLYYHESLALELVASCVALAVVLCMQFVWPLQLLLYHVGLGAGMQLYKLTLFSLHLFWLLVNLCVSAYFIIVTFRFVEQASRERFRDRYTAYVVLPRDLRRHFRQQLYLRIGRAGSPLAISGMECGTDGEGTVELASHFHRTSALVDVHTLGVRWVLRRWLARSAQAAGAPVESMPAEMRPCLIFPPLMDEPVHGMRAWCRRRGGVPLSGLERLVLRCSFRFRAVNHPHQAPTPSRILEGLIENAIAQVDGLSPVAFDSAFGEVTRYHQFLLGLSVAEGVDGVRFSLAEVPGFGWHPPHRPWSTQYRRLFRRGADVVGEDTHFFNALAQTPNRLLPRHGEQPLPDDLVRELFRLGPMLTQSLEGWVGLRSAAAGGDQQDVSCVRLSGIDAALHHDVMSGLIQSWEAPLHEVPVLYGWRDAAGQGEARYWAALCAAFPFLWQHLAETARSLIHAVQNGDEVGAQLFMASLLRWSEDVLRKAGVDAHHHDVSPSILQDLVSLNWEQVGQRADHASGEKPGTLFAQLLNATHEDMLFLVLGLLVAAQVKNPAHVFYGETARALFSQRQADVWLAAAVRHRLLSSSASPIYADEVERLRQGLNGVLAHPAMRHGTVHPVHAASRDELEQAGLALILAADLPVLPQAWVISSLGPVERILPEADALSETIGEMLRVLQPEMDENMQAARLRQALEGR